MGKCFFDLIKLIIIYFLANFKDPRLNISFRIINLVVFWSHPSPYISLIKIKNLRIPTHIEMATTLSKMHIFAYFKCRNGLKELLY